MRNKIVSILFFILLLSVFIIINFFNNDSRTINDLNSNKNVTTKVLSGDVIIDKTIYINDEEESVKFKVYDSYLGYKVSYMMDYYNINNFANSSILISLIEDANTFLRIEKLGELEYYNEYEKSKDYSYKGYYVKNFFLKDKNMFFKLTKSYKTDDIINNKKIDYMINSIEI